MFVYLDPCCYFIEKMGGVKIRTTSRISSDIFNGIVKFGSGLKKKKKKGKKVSADLQMKVPNS